MYPVECKNNNFSNPNDLQSAIEGNKREGRTSSFGPYGGMGPMQHSPLPPSMGGGMHMMGMMGTPPRPMQINGNRPPMHPGECDHARCHHHHEFVRVMDIRGRGRCVTFLHYVI